MECGAEARERRHPNRAGHRIVWRRQRAGRVLHQRVTICHVTVSPSPPGRVRARRSFAPPLVALFIAAFGFLPIANWIPRGAGAPWYHIVAGFWLSGSFLVIGVGVVLAILSRTLHWLWRDDALRAPIAAWRDHPRRAPIAIASVALVAYLLVASGIFSGRPLFIDEITQLLHAQIFAGGRLWRATGPHPEFFGSMFVVNTSGRTFTQFPAGGPAMLVPGVLLGVPWISDPIYGAIAVLAFAAFVRVAEPRPGAAMGATVIFAFAPLALFMSGTHMNHVATLMFVAIAIAAMAHVMTADAPRPWIALLNGVALGCAATIRPVDALAFALPAGAWYLVRALRDAKRWADALAAGVGVALPLAALFWINAQTTGRPLLFGYELVWGASHALGFPAAPVGAAHAAARGVELINIYFLQLQTYLFETPVPSLLPAILAFALTRKFGTLDRYLVVSSALLVGLYFSFWYEGFYLGPRYVYLLLPVLALYTARVLPLVREHVGAGLPYRTAVYGAICATVVAATALIPVRARSYRNTLTTMRWDADAAARAAGIDHALVLVRTSWGTQLIARLWALGISRPEAELVYRSVDACRLESRLDSLERVRASNAAAAESVHSLVADSARVVNSHLSPDTTERVQPGLIYPQRCGTRIREDREGFTLFTPLLLAHGGQNIYAQDLGARDSLLLGEYPTRRVYLLRPASARIGDPPRFYALSRDSLLQAWRSEPATTESPREVRR
jgi:hypothetical protein